MKKIAILLSAVMLLTMMMVPALAADSPSQQGVTVTSSTATDANGNAVTVNSAELVVTPVSNASSLSAEKQAAMEQAAEEVTSGSAAVTEVLDQALADTGLDSDDMECATYFELSVEGDAAELLANGGSITVTFTVDGVQAGDTVVVMHKTASGAWESVPVTVSNGTVTATFTSLSPVAIFVEKADAAVAASASAAGAPTSPQTGSDSTPVAVYVVAILACFAGARAVKKFA